jgi:hypothetical protein
MTFNTSVQRLISIGLLAALLGCESNPALVEQAAAPKEALQFIDLQSFDQDLSGSLNAVLPKVDVNFYNQIAPSALPDRLQNWMVAVQSGGGTVKVVPPKSTLTAKNPFLLISAVSSLWTASKMIKAASVNAQFTAAKVYDAEIMLKTDDHGQSWVDKVVFTQRKK